MRWLRAYPALLRAYIANSLEYRAQILIWILSGVLPLVMMLVWLAISEQQAVPGYSSNDFVSYYLAVIFIRRMVGVWFVWDLDRSIRQGTLSSYLLKPIDPVHHYFTRSALAGRPLQLALIGPPLLLAALLLDAHYAITLSNVLLMGVAIFGAILIEFFAQMIIGCLAFWITQAIAVVEAWFLIRSLLSGWIVPLDLFPPAVLQALTALPFRYLLFFPVEIILGRVAPAEIGLGLLVQYGWAIAFFLGYRFVWQRGLKHYGAVGA
jgi:ABC-2 type transport system permease protein